MISRTLFAFALLVPVANAFAECTTDLQIYSDAVAGKQKFGFSYQGEEVIPAQFDEVGGNPRTPFCDGLATVKKDGRWGYIDKRGSVVIPFEYLATRPYEHGFAAVRRSDGWILLDRNNKALCEGGPFFFVGRVTEGMLSIRVLDGADKIRHGFVDAKCKPVGAPVYDETGEFHRGVAPVLRDGKWTWLTRNGEEAAGVGAMEEKPYFWSGFWTARVDRKEGLVGELGEVVLPAEYSGISSFHDGVFGVRRFPDHRYAYFDTKTRKFVTEFLFLEVREFAEGLAGVRTEDATVERPSPWGFIDKTGAWVLSPRFVYIERDFAQGKAVVWTRTDGRNVRRFIDRNGNFLGR